MEEVGHFFVDDQQHNFWWKAMQWRQQDWEPFVQKLLKRLHLARLSPFFSQTKSEGGSWEEEVDEEDVKEKVAKRIAANFENEAQFDLDTERVPFEL